MLITHLRLKNWRNFRELDVPLRDVSYILGANASGKSNFLDVFRFLRDVSKPNGGGLQTAVNERGGMSKLRCLHARQDTEVLLEVELSDTPDGDPVWTYVLGFKSEGKGKHRVIISKEEVHKGTKAPLKRPNAKDLRDPELLTQTHLEQIQANVKFRQIVEFFSDVTYQNLVPQLLKFSDRIGGRQLTDDPYGQGFLEKISNAPEKTRASRLNRICKALSVAVPLFADLRFSRDSMGHPHLEALYTHHRPNAGWQTEEQFSDGTLRLIGILWTLLDGNALLLLEEPEISLNDAIVSEIPAMIQRTQRSKKVKRQIILSTHSEELLGNPGIDGRGIVVLQSGPDGTSARTITRAEEAALESGLSVAEVVLPKTRPRNASRIMDELR